MSKHHVLLMVTDFVSVHLADDIFYFIQSKKQHDLMLNIVVVLDEKNNSSELNPSRVLQFYGNFVKEIAAKVDTPVGFENLMHISPPLTSCRANSTAAAIISP
uniref:Uncharacterized protein n=1 Tax=Plectus sambesii TaxID=2011161 RepID=A0A914WCJ9_9BILA